MNKLTPCHCHSGLPYASCCEPCLSNTRAAATAQALMRSRYSAYVVGNLDYLLQSWHPSTRPESIDPATVPQWHDLKILSTERGKENDLEGTVEFKAIGTSHGKRWELHEVSRFVKEEGQWLYVDADTEINPAPHRTKKVGRNAPCPCGSNRKFKKCCGP